jgi:hypothetical protein
MPVAAEAVQALGERAIGFGQDIQLAGDVRQNTSGGGYDADFETDAPRTPQKVAPFVGFNNE